MNIKKLTPNLLVIVCVLVGLTYYSKRNPENLDYWTFIAHHLVLNVGMAAVGLGVGYFVKNYIYVLTGASFILVIYCSTYSFQQDFTLMGQFFLAIYSVILAFSAMANIARHYQDWVLTVQLR